MLLLRVVDCNNKGEKSKGKQTVATDCYIVSRSPMTFETEIGMDTDYLTPMAYDCIRLANEATDVLKSELGAACSQYRDENVYLADILDYVKEIEEAPEDYLDWWNLLEQTDIIEFRKNIRILREHIEKTIIVPVTERGEPDF